MSNVRLDGIERAIADIKAGRAVIVIDDEDRENEGDLIFAAELATPELVAFMVRYTSGYICVPLTEVDADRLDLPPMFHTNQDRRGTAYTVTVDARDCAATGISATDRAHTIRLLADRSSVAGDLLRPGHVVPLRARDGGVLSRSGHTEAAVDLAVLAGLRPAGVLCEIVSEWEPGGMARSGELGEFADRHGLALVSIADLIEFRRRTEKLVERVATTTIPLRRGSFTTHAYRNTVDDREHLAFVHGDLGDGTDVLTRVHLECLFGDVFDSQRCRCRNNLDAALDAVLDEGRGVVIYVRAHEHGDLTGMRTSLQSCERSNDASSHSVPGRSDGREIGTGCQILADLGVRTLRVLTDHHTKYAGIEGHGLRVTGHRPLGTG